MWAAGSGIENDRAYVRAVADYTVDNKSLQHEVQANPDYLVEMCFHIVDKDKKTTPFFFNEVQRDFIDRLKRGDKEYKTGERLFKRYLVLKGRQLGFTSVITAYQLACTITTPNFEGFTAADEDANTSAIFENKGKYIYSMLPDKLKPSEKYNNRKQLLFEELHSSWEIKTASKNMGRSRTVNFFHGCIHGDSLVIMADNTSKLMKDIKIGDVVITANGNHTKVVNKWDVGNKQTFEVKTWLTNQSVKMTAEHKVLTIDGYKRCEELTSKDWICVPTKKFTGSMTCYKYQKPRTRSHIYSKREILLDYNFGYFLGYYLAEGHVKKNAERLEFASHRDETYITTAHKAIGHIADYKTILVTGSFRAKHIYDSRELASLVLDICGRTEDKHLPDWIYKTNKEFAKGLIAGYFAGDGSKTTEKWSRIRATCVVEKISRGMRLLIASVYKVVPSLHYKNDVKRYDIPVKSAFNLSVHGDCAGFIQEQIDIEPCNNRRSWISKFKNVKGKLYVRIKSIRTSELADVFDIEVENKEHNFLTTIGIVSNSEAAFWKDGISGVQAGLGEAMTKDAVQILESTANGYNEFKDLWDSGEWENCFYEWWRTPEYRYNFENEGKRAQFIADVNSKKDWIFERCRWLIVSIKLEWEQVYWYYTKWKGYIFKDTIKQEYPCVARGQLVSTNSGIVKIEDVAIGSYAETGEIINKWNKGSKKILKITTKNNRILRVTSEHRIATCNGYVEAQNISIGTELILSKPIFADRLYEVIWEPNHVQKNSIVITPEIGLFIGYFMGDGSFQKTKNNAVTVDFACDKKDTDVVDELIQLCTNIIGTAPIIRTTGSKSGCTNIRSNNSKWFELLKNLGLLRRAGNNEDSNERYMRKVSVPDFIQKSPKEVVRMFLAGLFEADGCAYQYTNRIKLFSKHEDFLRDVQLLLLGFGIGCSITIENKINGEGNVYIGRSLNVPGNFTLTFKSEIGFRSNRKNGYCDGFRYSAKKPIITSECDAVKTIEEDGYDEVYDLMIEKKHCFGVNGILVHNCTPDEAFLASGSCIFNKELLIQRKDFLKKLYAENPPKRGDFIITWNDPVIMDKPLAACFFENAQGCIMIYHEPEPGHPYCLGGDTKGEGSDFFTGTVKNNHNGDRCATLYMQGLTSKPYAAQMWALANYYNEALVGIEINFNTYPVELFSDWNYPRQYMRERTDTITKEVKKSFGWKTDGNTRPLIIERQITAVEENIDCFNDIPTIDEMLTFIKDKEGRYDATEGKHDDLLFSDMISDAIGSQQTRTIETAREAPDLFCFDDDGDGTHKERHRDLELGGFFD